jgi:hypothetical protein
MLCGSLPAMDTPTPRLSARKALQLWILFSIPVTLALALAFSRFGLHSRTVTTMEQRQNRLPAQDALRVSQALADFYTHAAEAARALSVLPSYFDRFLSFSLLPGEIAVFRAANLSGLDRVVSVAPVSLPTALFVQAGTAGYVSVGCAVEFFREPEEKMLPYY